MSFINLDHLEGNTLLKKLLHYIKPRADLKKKKPFYLVVPEAIPAESQRGETCKLKVLADAMYHTSSKTQTSCPPLYKNKNSNVFYSIRQLAKASGSAVGEIYSLNQLVSICEYADFEATTYAPYNEDDYIKQICGLVEKNLAPMVFFDVDLTSGERYGCPSIGEGKNEHAALVVGYYKNQQDEVRFLVCQWDSYYDFDGMELALSTMNSLKENREPETFKKVKDLEGSTLWVLDSKISAYPEVLPVFARKAKPKPADEQSLKGKIMVVLGPKPKPQPLFFSPDLKVSKATDTLKNGEANASLYGEERIEP